MKVVRLVGVAVLGVLAVLLFRFGAARGLDGLDKLASIVGAAVGIVALYLSIRPPTFLSARSRGISAEAEAEAEDVLVARVFTTVARRLLRELAARDLPDRDLLPIPWKADGCGAPYGVAAATEDLVSALTDSVSAPGSPERTVVLGRPGAGKSGVLLSLGARLVREQTDAVVVPLFLRLAFWDPRRDGFEDWVVRESRNDYGLSRTEATTLFRSKRLLLLLDGLDEMPADSRGSALTLISAEVGLARLVLTSRESEYRELVRGRAGVRPPWTVLGVRDLSAVAVSELVDRRARAAAGVVDDERMSPRLLSALNTPFLVSVAVEAYLGGRRIDLTGCETQSAVEAAVIDSYSGHTLQGDELPPEALGRRWSSADLLFWLAAHARSLRERNDHELSWWSLYRSTPWCHSWVRVLVAIPTGTCAASLLWLTSDLIIGVLYGMLWMSSAVLFRRDFPLAPQRLVFQREFRVGLRRGSVANAARRTGILLGVAVVVWFLLQTVTFLVGSDGRFEELELGYYSVDEYLPAFLFAGLVAFVLVVARPIRALDLKTGRYASTATLERDLFLTLVVLGGVVLCSQVFELFIFEGTPSTTSETLVLIGAVAVGAPFVQAWGAYLVAVLWNAARGWSPLRYRLFLTVATDRGVLRRVGQYHAFRHELMRDRLAEYGDRSGKPRRAAT